MRAVADGWGAADSFSCGVIKRKSFAENRGSPGAVNLPGDSCGRILSRGLAGGRTFKFSQTIGPLERRTLARLGAAT
jgi:hypothetical protein